jgi:hypothetical protein
MSLNLEYERAMRDDVGTFRFEEKGYLCEITRHEKDRHWCGYICVDSHHPWHKRHYDSIDADCHGGLTYSEDDKDKWKIGFDCAHFNDFAPAYKTQGIWRDRKYVENECKKLVEQAIEADIKHRDGVNIFG